MGPGIPFAPSFPAGPTGPGGPYTEEMNSFKILNVQLFQQ